MRYYLGSFLLILKILSTIRSSILLVTIVILIKGILGSPIYSLNIWINSCLFFTLIHMGTETVRYKYIKDTKIITSLFLTVFWILFINVSNLYIFMIDGTYQAQTLINAITISILTIYLYQNLRRSFEVFARIKVGSRLLITLSFLLVIIIGTVLLMLPIARSSHSIPISLVNAFFTAVSAVCVTGLIVVDTATYFSRFGQIIIMCLIQIGALGLVTITTTLLSLLGQRLSLSGHLSAKNSVSNVTNDKSLSYYLVFTLGFTILIEFSIALSLFPQFIQHLPFSEAIFYSLFHAVSSFCNAGFALFSNSLVDFRNNISINLSIMLSIIIGGLGFGIWLDIKSRFISKESKFLSLQTLIALRASIFLIFLGAFVFYILEKNNVLAHLSLREQILSAFFASVNLRTAGFNTIDLGQTNEASRFFSLLMMYIGASPGSTGGGIKTTSFMVLWAAVHASITNNQNVIIFGKRIDDSLIAQAWTLVFNSLSWIFVVVLVISAVDKFPLSAVAYETFSAYATVGVSTGITSSLSPISKVLISITMILGRIGPTTVMLAFIGKQTKPSLIKTPPEKLSIG